jgi:hypothetical protein
MFHGVIANVLQLKWNDNLTVLQAQIERMEYDGNNRHTSIPVDKN